MAIFSAIVGFVANAVFLSLATAGFTVGVATALALGAGYLAAGLVAAGLAKALAPKPSRPSTEIKANITQTDAPRRVFVGRYLTGGLKAFFDVSGQVLHQLFVANHGRIEAFDAFVIDGETTAVDGSGITTAGPAEGAVQVQTHNGSGDGGNYAALRSDFPTTWTVNHKLTGQATFYTRSTAPKPENFTKKFPKGENTTFQWEIRGSRVYDPRSNATAYSDNAALVQRFYLTHPDGARLDGADIDDDNVAAMASWCDLSIPQNGGGVAPNMRLWGYWTMDEQPVSVLDRMAASSGIKPYEMQDGRIGLVGGPIGDPACTITHKDIRQIQTYSANDERTGYNHLRVSFLSAAHRFEMVDVAATEDVARQAVEGQIAQEFRPEMCPNQSQAKRLAKRRLHDDNRARVEIITNLVGIKARWPAKAAQRHTIILDYRPEDGSGRVISGTYEVIDHEFDPVGLECRIMLAAVADDADDWTPAEEGPAPPPLPPREGNPPPAFVGTASSDGSNRLVVSATIPGGRDDLEVRGRYSPDSGATWINMTTYPDAATAISDESVAAGTYDVEGRWVGVFDGTDDWHSLGTVTV